MHGGGLEIALVFLLAGIIAVPFFKRLGLGAILAYLVVGALLGPSVFGVVKDTERILSTSQFGVVMLLFVIGLELSPSRLVLMRRPVLGTGGLQVLLTTILCCAGYIFVFHLDFKSAVIIGMALSLSSTAVSMQLLSESKALSSDYGTTGFAVLLFQDLAAIPLLVAIPLLGQASVKTFTGSDLIYALAAIGLVFLGGRFLLGPLFRMAARTGMPEVFTACALLVVLGTAWFMEWVGLSADLGAFLAGMMLSDSEFRHELESQIEPFKGLLLGLFFMAVGMSLNLNVLIHDPLMIAAGVISLLIIKGGVLVALGRWLEGMSWKSALKLAGVLWLGGEFAFVLFDQAFRGGLISELRHNRLVAIVSVSMALTPLLLLATNRWLDKMSNETTKANFETVDDTQPQVLVAGMGRVGQVVTRMLTAQHIPFVALEFSAEIVQNLRNLGNSRLFYADPTRPDVMRSAGAQHCKVFVVAMADPEVNIRTTRLIRRMYPNATVLSRARNRQHAWRLMDLSAESFRETFGSSLEMGQRVFTALGIGEKEALDHMQRFRKHDEHLLREQHLVYDDEAGLIQSSRDSFTEVEKLFAADAPFDDNIDHSQDTDPMLEALHTKKPAKRGRKKS